MLPGWLQQDDIDMGSQDDLQKLDSEPPGKYAGTLAVVGVLWRCDRGAIVSFTGQAGWCHTLPDLSMVRRLEPLNLASAQLAAVSAVAGWPATSSAPRLLQLGGCSPDACRPIAPPPAQ